MKKRIVIILLAFLLLGVVGCEKELKWPMDTYFKDLPVPAEIISKITSSNKTENLKEYSIIVNEYSYDEFYKYITNLENIGFNYEFYEIAVPKEKDNLVDKTETSWGANNGKIWIRALWRSKENPNYSGYNFQLILNNYDYLNSEEKEQ